MTNKIAHGARAEFLEGKNDTGILVIYGFTGSTQSMRLVVYRLHELGYMAHMPRLKGHGTTPKDMETTDYKDWIESTEETYKELWPKVKKYFY